MCDVTAYGAKNDASARATKAIHDAIQACAKAGGGTVYFPAGTYETGAIELASNIISEHRRRRDAALPHRSLRISAGPRPLAKARRV